MQNRVLTAQAAAEFVTRAGLPITPRTLAERRAKGKPPVFHKAGRRVLYRPADLLAFVDQGDAQ
jgi:hypothetical protein